MRRGDASAAAREGGGARREGDTPFISHDITIKLLFIALSYFFFTMFNNNFQCSLQLAGMQAWVT